MLLDPEGLPPASAVSSLPLGPRSGLVRSGWSTRQPQAKLEGSDMWPGPHFLNMGSYRLGFWAPPELPWGLRAKPPSPARAPGAPAAPFTYSWLMLSEINEYWAPLQTIGKGGKEVCVRQGELGFIHPAFRGTRALGRP